MTDSRALRLLCVDGGGVRGLVPLRVLQNLKKRTKQEPHQLFDLICGSGTGGVLAILLGLLKVPVDECVDLYKELGKEVFEVGWFRMIKNVATDRARFSSETLERCMKEVLQKYGHPAASSAVCGATSPGSPRSAATGSKPAKFMTPNRQPKES